MKNAHGLQPPTLKNVVNPNNIFFQCAIFLRWCEDACVVSVWFMFYIIVCVWVYLLACCCFTVFALRSAAVVQRESHVALGTDWPWAAETHSSVRSIWGGKDEPSRLTDWLPTQYQTSSNGARRWHGEFPESALSTGKHHCHNQIHYPPAVTEQTASIRYRPTGSALTLLLTLKSLQGKYYECITPAVLEQHTV